MDRRIVSTTATAAYRGCVSAGPPVGAPNSRRALWNSRRVAEMFTWWIAVQTRLMTPRNDNLTRTSTTTSPRRARRARAPPPPPRRPSRASRPPAVDSGERQQIHTAWARRSASCGSRCRWDVSSEVSSRSRTTARGRGPCPRSPRHRFRPRPTRRWRRRARLQADTRIVRFGRASGLTPQSANLPPGTGRAGRRAPRGARTTRSASRGRLRTRARRASSSDSTASSRRRGQDEVGLPASSRARACASLDHAADRDDDDPTERRFREALKEVVRKSATRTVPPAATTRHLGLHSGTVGRCRTWRGCADREPLGQPLPRGSRANPTSSSCSTSSFPRPVGRTHGRRCWPRRS